MIQSKNTDRVGLIGIFKFIGKIPKITVAWGRRFKIIRTPEDLKDLASRRLAICAVCKASTHSRLLEIMDGKAEWVETLVCTECHCPCVQKALVKTEKCPRKKW